MTTEDRLPAQSTSAAIGPEGTGQTAGAYEGSNEPIAILGMGCRFPGGVNSPDDLWQMLFAERDATAEFPTDRGWNLDALLGPDPDAPGATYVLRPGGYAVVFSDSGEVATVSTPLGFALPGGGQNDGESREEAAVREVEEECGLRVVLGRRIGVADELVYAADERTYWISCARFGLSRRALIGKLCKSRTN